MKIFKVLGCLLVISSLQCSSWAAPTTDLFQSPASNVTKRNAAVINNLFTAYICRISTIFDLVQDKLNPNSGVSNYYFASKNIKDGMFSYNLM